MTEPAIPPPKPSASNDSTSAGESDRPAPDGSGGSGSKGRGEVSGGRSGKPGGAPISCSGIAKERGGAGDASGGAAGDRGSAPVSSSGIAEERGGAGDASGGAVEAATAVYVDASGSDTVSFECTKVDTAGRVADAGSAAGLLASEVVVAQRRGGLVARLLRTKSPARLIAEANKGEVKLKKSLTAFHLIAFGLGATIGSGIFALTGTAAAGQAEMAKDWLSTPVINFVMGTPIGREGAGPAIVLSFVIAAIACGFAAMCYAELASMIPVSGSAYTFTYASMGELIAWIVGWDLILEYAVGNIAVAVSWSDYFVQFLHGVTGWKVPLWLTADTTTALTRVDSAADSPLRQLYADMSLPVLFGHPVAFNVPALVIVALITWLLVVGIKESARVNTVAVVIKVAVILFFIIYGMMFVNPDNWIPFAPGGLVAVMGGAAIVFFSFIGFDAISSTAEETKNPQRDMPVGMIGTLILCTALYCMVSLVLTGILPYQSYVNDAAPVSTALFKTGAAWAQMLVTAGALAGMTSVLLVFQLGQPRIFMAMARDGLLPKVFGRLHARFHTPVVPTIVTGVCVGFTALVMDIGQAAELTNIGTLAAFVLVCGGVIVLRKTAPHHPRAFKCPGSPVVPLLGIISCVILMLSLPVITWARFVGWMALGAAIYFFYGMRRSALAAP